MSEYSNTDTNTAEGKPLGYPPRGHVPAEASDQEDASVAARDAERFAVYAEELLQVAADPDLAPENNPHALAIATLAVAYELKALRIDRAGQDTAMADGLSGIAEAVAEFGKYLCGETRNVADLVGAVAYELNRVNADLAMRRGEG